MNGVIMIIDMNPPKICSDPQLCATEITSKNGVIMVTDMNPPKITKANQTKKFSGYIFVQ